MNVQPPRGLHARPASTQRSAVRVVVPPLGREHRTPRPPWKPRGELGVPRLGRRPSADRPARAPRRRRRAAGGSARPTSSRPRLELRRRVRLDRRAAVSSASSQRPRKSSSPIVPVRNDELPDSLAGSPGVLERLVDQRDGLAEAGVVPASGDRRCCTRAARRRAGRARARPRARRARAAATRADGRGRASAPTCCSAPARASREAGAPRPASSARSRCAAAGSYSRAKTRKRPSCAAVAATSAGVPDALDRLERRRHAVDRLADPPVVEVDLRELRVDERLRDLVAELVVRLRAPGRAAPRVLDAARDPGHATGAVDQLRPAAASSDSSAACS